MLMNPASISKKAKLKDSNKGHFTMFTAKDALYNGLVNDMNENGDAFPVSMSDGSVSDQVMVLVNAVWYISGNIHTIQERALHLTEEVKCIPERFTRFDDANDYKRKKQKRPVLLSKDSKIHSQCLFRMISRPFTQNWIIRSDIEKLAISLDMYSSYLDKVKTQQQVRQSELNPARIVDNNISIQHHKKVEHVLSAYTKVNSALCELHYFEPLFFDEEIHLTDNDMKFQTPDQRYKYFQNLKLSIDIHVLRYDPWAGFGALTFIWKVPSDMSSAEMFLKDNKVISALRPRLPEYHTRKMSKDFYNLYENIAGVEIPPFVLRNIYVTLTNNATSNQNSEIAEKVRLAVLGSDPELVVDLRHMNKGHPGDSFSIFFEQLEKDIEEVTAADKRRHNEEHISRYLSVRDLIEQVKAKLPEATPIPSESTVLLAFVPKNAHANGSKLYKGRVPLRLKLDNYGHVIRMVIIVQVCSNTAENMPLNSEICVHSYAWMIKQRLTLENLGYIHRLEREGKNLLFP